MANGEVDVFKESFKLLKRLSVQDLRDKVIDLSSGDSSDKHPSEVDVLDVHSQDPFSEASVWEEASVLGLKPPHEWRVFTLKRVPGLLVIPNPFQPCGQHHWVERCMRDYPLKPNVCNLDAHTTRPENGQLWPTADKSNLHPSCTNSASSSCVEEDSKVSHDIERKLNAQHCKKPHAHDVTHDQDHQSSLKDIASNISPVSKKPPVKKRKLSDQAPLPDWLSRDTMLYKLRWVTLGYHYDWSSKEYSPQHRSTFPPELGQLSSFVLEAVGFPGFKAEAGIVNYYHLDSTLSGHTDHSEKDLSLPLLSISLGQSAVFLIGGQSKQVPPIPLLLNSGDIVIMSGRSRLAYHGIPRVLPPSHTHAVPWCLEKEQLKNCVCSRTVVRPGKTPSEFESSITVCKVARKEDGSVITDEDITIKGMKMNDGKCSEDSDCGLVVCSVCSQLANSWDTFVEYLCVSRININVRQVVSENLKFGT